MATEEQWRQYTDQYHDGKLTGDAKFARAVKATPLTAQAILDLVYENLDYFGDSYYSTLTAPIHFRVEEYYASIGKKI